MPFVNDTTASSTSAFAVHTTNNNTTTMTTITTITKDIKWTFLESIERDGELNQNTPFVWKLSKGLIDNMLGTVWCLKLKLTGLVVGDVELTKRQYRQLCPQIFLVI